MKYFKSQSQPNSFVILTKWADTYGVPVIVALHLDQKGAVTLENNIASAYGRLNIEAIPEKNGENILWTKGNEDIATLLSVRLQLPQAVADDTLVSKYKIPQETRNAKISEAPISKELFEQQTDQIDNVPAPGYNNIGNS